jgi:hypothetical protein
MKMTQSNNHGGKRPGAGRPSGSLNKRSLEAIEAVASRYPNWSPLLHFASVANDETLPPELRLDAAKAAAPFMHPRPKQIDLDPNAVVELERRTAEARASAIAKQGLDPYIGLGDRLERAHKRLRGEIS